MTHKINHANIKDWAKNYDGPLFDGILCDPPYELGFMGKSWDSSGIAFDTEMWEDIYKLLKPGAHLLAFSGSRTYHRMAVAIEDAGFEIRDQLIWMYGSGFPKSLNIGKAVDKIQGNEREQTTNNVTCPDFPNPCNGHPTANRSLGGGANRHALPTKGTSEWEGYGTAVKPAIEPCVLATKPFTDVTERSIIVENLYKLNYQLWSLLLVSTAKKSLALNQPELKEALSIAQWTAEEATNTLADLSGLMDMLQLELAITMSLNTVSSWKNTLDANLQNENTSTTKTTTSKTIDWKTLRFSLSKLTPIDIIKVATQHAGLIVPASPVARHFNAELSKLNATLELSATESVIDSLKSSSLDIDKSRSHEPCVLARKPLDGTVANNVLKHGTGGLNIDGTRVGATETITNHSRSAESAVSKGKYGDSLAQETHQTQGQQLGRFPANLIHDGSDEVEAVFPQTGKSTASGYNFELGSQDNPSRNVTNIKSGVHFGDSGSASRFFYTAKASKSERNAGLEGFEPKREADRNKDDGVGGDNPRNRSNNARQNHHPTVKPLSLTKYLATLIKPPTGGRLLVPFSGSGSEMIGALQAGWEYVEGVELTEEYIPIAEARIKYWLKEKEAESKQLALV